MPFGSSFFALEKKHGGKQEMIRTTTCLESTGLTLLSSQYIQPPLEAMNAVSEDLKNKLAIR